MLSIIKKMALVAVSCFFAVSLVSCASIVSGQRQPVAVDTGPVKAAKCTLENNKGTWVLTKTPGSVLINRSYHDLKIVCKKPGFKTITKNVSSTTKPLVFGNVILGGPIGAGIDIASGAAYDYPASILVPMNKA